MPTEYSASKQSVLDITKERPKIDALISQWDEDKLCVTRRDVRKKEYNVREMQNKKELAPDETYIARRIIDGNITREKPEFINYIEGSPRLVLFKSKSQPERDNTALADWFALGMKYQNWNEPWHRVFDSCRLHGCAWMEVKPDDTKPFNLALEYVPREFLIFPKKLRRSIQKCEKVLRKYEYLPNELEDAVETFGFNKDVVNKLTESSKQTKREDPICVYKVYCKYKGIVYIAWYSQDQSEKWLKDPEECYLGEYAISSQAGEGGQVAAFPVPVPCSKFPFFELLYEYNEEEELLNCKGRAARDLADQDAISSLWTSMVNGTNRASKINASRVNGPNTEGAQSEVIEQGKIYPTQIEWNSMPYPDPSILQTAQALSIENTQSAGKVDFAVANRKDSRKTATELDMAQSQSAKLSSVNMTPVANFVVALCDFCWNIVQSQVVVSGSTDTTFLIPPDNIPPEWFTDEYILASSGDAEVIKRAEKIANMQMDLPLLSNTPIYNDVLAKYIELRYPGEAAAWKAKLESTNLLPIVQQLVSVLASVPTDNLTPDQQQALNNIMTNANAAVLAAGVPGRTQPVAPAGSNENDASGNPPPNTIPLPGGGSNSRQSQSY